MFNSSHFFAVYPRVDMIPPPVHSDISLFLDFKHDSPDIYMYTVRSSVNNPLHMR